MKLGYYDVIVMVAMMSQQHYKEITKIILWHHCYDITHMTVWTTIVFYDITQEQQIVFGFEFRKWNKTNIFLININ